jgi:hypothetical protein
MHKAKSRQPALDPAEIDATYGLEPVLEIGPGEASLEAFLDALCPYCGETYGLAVDLSPGEHTFIEDCTVCCQPIAFALDLSGEQPALRTERT